MYSAAHCAEYVVGAGAGVGGGGGGGGLVNQQSTTNQNGNGNSGKTFLPHLLLALPADVIVVLHGSKQAGVGSQGAASAAVPCLQRPRSSLPTPAAAAAEAS